MTIGLVSLRNILKESTPTNAGKKNETERGPGGIATQQLNERVVKRQPPIPACRWGGPNDSERGDVFCA